MNYASWMMLILIFKAKTIRLRETKGGRDDIVYIKQECVETLQAYLKVRPQVNIKGRIPLFYTDSLNFWGKNDVHRMFLYYKKKLILKNPVQSMYLVGIQQLL
jgi:integrase/recombinase XerD